MLSIEDVATRTLVVEAVLKAIPQERRDQLVKEALATLLVPQGSGYGEKRSTLEDAFRSATYDMARKHAEEWLRTDERFAKAVKELHDRRRREDARVRGTREDHRGHHRRRHVGL